MELRASTARSYLERMLLDGTAEPKALPLSLLEDITGGFSDDQQIGSGGFAVVYKGILGDTAVAVKRLSNVFMDETEFHREVECLMQVKHTNIVRFFGYCADRQGSMERYNGKFVMADVHQRLLCFEYIPNGSLDKYITDEYRQWGTCYAIIRGICEGLQYLHENHIIHLDLKPANILLGDNMVLESWSDRLDKSQRDTQREQIRVCYKTALQCRDFNPKKRPTSARDIIDKLHEVESIRMSKLAGRLLRNFLSSKKDKGKDVSGAGSEETPKCVAVSRTVTPESKQKGRWSFRSRPAGFGPVKDAAKVELAFPNHHAHAFEETPKWVAVVAQQAAATTVRYGAVSRPGPKLAVITIQDAAAIKIQSVVRSYLARRTLRALKALVRLQALARGQQVRRQMSTTLRCMQSIVGVQKLSLAARRQRQLLNGGRRPGYVGGARAVAVPLARPQGNARLYRALAGGG